MGGWREAQRSRTQPAAPSHSASPDRTPPTDHPAVGPRATTSSRGRWRPRRPSTSTADDPGASQMIDLQIEPGDPVLAFLQTAPGPVDLALLPAYSPAVRHMKARGVCLVVPLVASGELVGLLALGERLSERAYSRDDRHLLDNLARHAAPALRLGQLVRQQQEEARGRERIEQELRVAQIIQQQFLPKELPELRDWHVAAFYRPARTVGGDFYDVIPLEDGRFLVVTGDVTDKGVPAALVMASTHALLRSTATGNTTPGEVLFRVNQLLVEQIPSNMFVTCLVLLVDPLSGEVVFANAGHNVPYLRRGDTVVQLVARGMPLGLMKDSTYEEQKAVVGPGDLLLLYSDGITEQHDAEGQMFGYARTKEIVAAASSGDDLVDRCVAALSAFATGVELEDDVTLVALERGVDGGFRRLAAFSVPSAVGNERLVMDRVAAAVAGELPAERLDALRTAVAETAMNAIEHGNRHHEQLPVEVMVKRTPDAVTVDVTDFGRGRDPARAEVPDLELKLAGLQPPRGWGLFLVSSLVDRVEEHTVGDRHTVRLSINAAAPAPATPERLDGRRRDRPSTRGAQP